MWSPQERLSSPATLFCREFFGQCLIYCPFPFAPYSPLGGVSLAEVALPSPQGPLAAAGWASAPLLISFPSTARGPMDLPMGQSRLCTRHFSLCCALDCAGDILGTPGGTTWGLGGNYPGRVLAASGRCLGWPWPTVPSRHQQLMKQAWQHCSTPIQAHHTTSTPGICADPALQT